MKTRTRTMALWCCLGACVSETSAPKEDASEAPASIAPDGASCSEGCDTETDAAMAEVPAANAEAVLDAAAPREVDAQSVSNGTADAARVDAGMSPAQDAADDRGAAPMQDAAPQEAGCAELDGACRDACRPGEFFCRAGNSQRCDADGTSHEYRVCLPNLPERCDADGTRATNANYGQCVDNSPFVMCADGQVSLSHDCSFGVALTLNARAVVAQPFVPVRSGRVTRLGMRTAQVAIGDAAWLSLHADQDGQPGALINRTLSPVALSQNTLNFAQLQSLTLSATALQAGSRYWMVATVSSGAPQLLLQNGSVEAGPYRSGSVPAQSSLVPGNLANGATQAASGQISLFVEFQR